jgi:rRNA maturation endonuclease Nob1
MTREEAIHILENLKPTNTNSSFDAYVIGKALTMAISALSENKGEWIYQEGVTPYKWRCNKCEKMFKTDFNYCPNCGKDMRGEI